jgi:hypothetical protein
VPEGRAKAHADIADYSRIRSDPISLHIHQSFPKGNALTSRRRGYFESEMGTHLMEGTIRSSWPAAPWLWSPAL